MNLKHLAAFAAVAALAAPTAATAEPGKAKGRSDEARAQQQNQGKAKGHAKPKNAVFKGTVVGNPDATAGSLVVKVEKANRWGRRFKGQDVTFTTATVKKINVADTNGDSKRDLADVKAGDKVLVQARITKDATPPLAARKLNDLTSPEDDD